MGCLIFLTVRLEALPGTARMRAPAKCSGRLQLQHVLYVCGAVCDCRVCVSAGCCLACRMELHFVEGLRGLSCRRGSAQLRCAHPIETRHTMPHREVGCVASSSAACVLLRACVVTIAFSCLRVHVAKQLFKGAPRCALWRVVTRLAFAGFGWRGGS